MEPLRGNAEQISAKIAAVIHMNTIVIKYDDLQKEKAVRMIEDREQFTFVNRYHIAAGPPAWSPRKKAELRHPNQ